MESNVSLACKIFAGIFIIATTTYLKYATRK